MSYGKLKAELADIVQQHYQSGTPLIDIRAALHAADLLAEQLGAFDLWEMAKQSQTNEKENSNGKPE